MRPIIHYAKMPAIIVSFPGPVQLFIACSMKRHASMIYIRNLQMAKFSKLDHLHAQHLCTCGTLSGTSLSFLLLFCPSVRTCTVLSTLDVTHVRKDSRLSPRVFLRLCMGEPGNKTTMEEHTCITLTSYHLYQPTFSEESLMQFE